MKRRVIIFAVIFISFILFLYLSFSYIRPMIISMGSPTQTSIFAGPVNLELINQLRATQSTGEINKEQAIGLAELYCAQAHSPSKTSPSNVKTYYLTYKEAASRIISGQVDISLNPSTPVWLVSMNGTWEHELSPILGTPTSPLIFTRCSVIINAQTGESMGLTN